MAVDARWQIDNRAGRKPCAGRSPIGIVGGRHGTLRKRVQDVGEKQFLMLLLVMQADLEDAGHLGPVRILRDRKQPLDRFIDVGTEGRRRRRNPAA